MENENERKTTSIKKLTIKLNDEFLSKLNLYKTSLEKFSFDKKDVVITYLVDGNLTDDYFKLLNEKFSKKNSAIKIIFNYIYTSYEEEVDLNFRFKRDNIIFLINDNFKEREIDKRKLFFYPVLNDRENYKNSFDTTEVFLQQFTDFSLKINSNIYIITYEGLKGYRGTEENLDIYLDFILKEISLPIIILKEPFFFEEELLRPEKIANKKANWLFIFNLDHINSYSILDPFLSLIDPSIDLITGFGLIPAFISKDDIEMNFKNKMRQMKVKDYNYISMEYEKEPYKVITEFVNEGDIIYDFIVLFNKKKFSSQKYVNFEEIYLSNLNVIKSCYSNICIVSGK